MSTKVLLQVQDLFQEFSQSRFGRQRVVHALNGVSLELHEGETLGVVGETGCGKSTLCRTLMRIHRPTAGRVVFDGLDVSALSERGLRPLRRQMQMVFQDPADSMNPRLNVGAIIEEPLVIQTKLTPQQRHEKVLSLLDDVGLPGDAWDRYPHEFSGGQRQRIAIARALVLDPRVLICDEPVSALDVSVQSQVLNLLLDLQTTRRLTMLFVSHDLGVVRHMSDRVAVLYLGSVMELADSASIYHSPRHPYTQALIAAIPQTDPTRRSSRTTVKGEVPSPVDLPSGCPFQAACPLRMERCATEKPLLREIETGHWCACHRVP